MSDLGPAGSAGSANIKPPVEGGNPGQPSRPNFPPLNSHATATAESAKLIGKGIGNNDAHKAK